MWQDYIFTGGSVIFIIALLPSVLSKNKPALATSLTTGTTLFVFGILYATLHLWLTAVLTWAISSLWYTMAVQVFLKGKK